MSAFGSLVLAALAFVGTHFALSHPLRAPLAARLGAGGFQLLYTVVAFATFAWLILAARTIGPEPLWWTAPDWLWWLGAAIMLFASILLAGSFIGNPALPQPGANALASKQPHGVFRITRHPMMWSFALWAFVHLAVWPTPSNAVITAAIAFLALAGAAGQDAKKARLMGAAWQGWVERTSFVPFARGFAWPGWFALIGGIVVWLLATWSHGRLGAPPVGLWR